MADVNPEPLSNRDDPRLAKAVSGPVLHQRTNYSKDRRIVLCHATEKSRLKLTCATESALESACPHSYKTVHTPDFGQVAFTIDARPGSPIQLTKYMVYHTSDTASAEELCGRAEWTMDRVCGPGIPAAARLSRALHGRFLAPKRCADQGHRRRPNKAQHCRDPTSDPFQSFSHLQASAGAKTTGVPAKGLTGRAYEGPYFWDTEIYLLPFLIYTSPRIARNLLAFRTKCCRRRGHARN